jgi:hypothetical protein
MPEQAFYRGVQEKLAKAETLYFMFYTESKQKMV